MEEEKFQKELFVFESQKKPFSRLTDIFPKADFEGKVTLAISLEKLVLISIGIIMAMVIVYALGVESGRSSAKAPAEQKPKAVTAPALPINNVQNKVAVMPDKNILNTAPIAPLTKPATAVKHASQGQPKATVAPQISKQFTILACTFTKLQNAQNAAAGLAKQGFTSSVTYSAPYYRVCVGAYADKNSPEAQRDVLKVKRFYKDAMFRLR